MFQTIPTCVGLGGAACVCGCVCVELVIQRGPSPSHPPHVYQQAPARVLALFSGRCCLNADADENGRPPPPPQFSGR